MSSIPSHAMPHAKAPHDDDEAPKPAETSSATKSSESKPEGSKSAPSRTEAATAAASDWIDDATGATKAGVKTATDTVKAHPKTAFAVGAAVIAGIAAAVVAPVLRADSTEKKPDGKATAKKSSGKGKSAA